LKNIILEDPKRGNLNQIWDLSVDSFLVSYLGWKIHC